MEVRALIGHLQPIQPQNSLSYTNQSFQDTAQYTQFDNEQLSKTLNQINFQNAITKIQDSHNDYMNIQIESSASKTLYNVIDNQQSIIQQHDRQNSNQQDQYQFQNNEGMTQSIANKTTIGFQGPNKMYRTSYDKQQSNNVQRQQYQQYILDNNNDDKKQARQIYASTYRVKRQNEQYKQMHSLYEIDGKNKMNSRGHSLQSQYGFQKYPQPILNYVNNINTSQLKTDISTDIQMNEQDMDFLNSIKISRVANQSNINNSSTTKHRKARSRLNNKINKSVHNRSLINTDINNVSKSPKLIQEQYQSYNYQQHQPQNITNADAGQGLNQVSVKSKDNKHLELQLQEMDASKEQTNEKNISHQSGANQGLSELQSPHSVQENTDYMLRPKGLIVLNDNSFMYIFQSQRTNMYHSNRTNQAFINNSQYNSINQYQISQPLDYDSITKQVNIENKITEPLQNSSSDQIQQNDIIMITSDSQLDNSNFQIMLTNRLQNIDKSMDISQLKNQSLTSSAIKNQSAFKKNTKVKRSQSSISDLNTVLDVVPLSTDHILTNQNNFQQQAQRINKSHMQQNKSVKQSIQIKSQELQNNNNNEYLQIIVERKGQPVIEIANVEQTNIMQQQYLQQVPQQLTIIQSHDNINSSASNIMSSVNNQTLLPVPKNMQIKTQNHGSISHTPPNWDAVYQHNNQSTLDRAKDQESIINGGMNSKLQKDIFAHKSQSIEYSNMIQRDQQLIINNNHNITTSEHKLNNNKFQNGSDKIDVKTLRLDNKQSQDTNLYKKVSDINILNVQVYSDKSPYKQHESSTDSQNQILHGQIDSNILNSNDHRELIFSVQRSEYQINSNNDINQASMRELCIGTDELENLMNEDQLSSQLSSSLLMQFQQNHQHNGQLQGLNGNINGYEQNQNYRNQVYYNRDLYVCPHKRQNFSPTKDSKLNSQRLTIENNSRVIVKNILGKNKVLYVQDNGKSIDIDLVKEIKCDKLKIEGNNIQPMLNNKNNLNNSMFSSIILDPKFPNQIQNDNTMNNVIFNKQQIKDNSNSDINDFITQNSNLNNEVYEEKLSQIVNNQTLNSKDMTNFNSPIKNSNLAQNFSDQKQDPKNTSVMNNLSTPITELLRYSQNRNNSQISSQIPRNLVPTVLITSSNFRNVKQQVKGNQELNYSRDDMFLAYDPQNVTRQQLKSLPKIETRTKTQQGQRVVLFSQNNYHREENNVNTLRGLSKDVDSPNVNHNAQNQSFQQDIIVNLTNQNQKQDKQIEPQINSDTMKKGLLYKISQQFTNAAQRTPNKLHSIENLNDNGIPLVKSFDQNTLREIYLQHKRGNMTQDNFYKKRSISKDIITQPHRLMNIQEGNNNGLNDSRNMNSSLYNNNKDQSFEYQDNKHQSSRMRTTQGTINGYLVISKNHNQIHALEKKIFRRERVLNNADKTNIEMQCYPFIIPNQNHSLPTELNTVNNYQRHMNIDSVLSKNENPNYNHMKKSSQSQNYKQHLPQLQNSQIDKDLAKPNTFHRGNTQKSLQSKLDISLQHINSISHPFSNPISITQTRNANHSNLYYENLNKEKLSYISNQNRMRKTFQHNMSNVQKGSTVAILNSIEQEEQKKNQLNLQQQNNSFYQNYNYSGTNSSSIQKKARRNLTSIIQQNKNKSDGIILI